VIIFETRDSVIDIIEDQEKRGIQKVNVEIDFFKLVMEKKYNKQGICCNPTQVISAGQPTSKSAVAWLSEAEAKTSTHSVDKVIVTDQIMTCKPILQDVELIQIVTSNDFPVENIDLKSSSTSSDR